LDPKEALQLALAEALAAGADQADAQWDESENFSLDVFEGKSRNIERSDSASLGLRVLVGGRPGYASTERATPEAVRKTARDAVALARYTDPTGIRIPEPVAIAPVDLELHHPDAAAVGPERMLRWCLEAEAEALSADSRVVNVPHLGASRGVSRSILANSRGFLGERISASVAIGVGAVARQGGVDKMGWDGATWRNPSRIGPGELARRAVERSTELLGAAPIPSGPLPVLFDRRVSGQFLSIFLGAFLADSVQKGQSRLVGRVGERMGPVGFHLSTDPGLPGMSGSRAFDGEGLPVKPRRILDDGILTGFLHNLETAAREGIAPTGDAARGGSGRVGAGFSNLVVDCTGGKSDDALLAAYPEVLHVVKLEGSTGCNPISGDISIGVQGFRVRGGSREPVDRISLSGNFFEILPALAGWGNQPLPGVRSQLVPSLLFESLRVAS
jgi:PmbA protein